MAAVPADVWRYIISFSDRQDLAELTRVSWSFLSLARPILYRSVVLYSCREAVKDTFDLLARDHSLARNVTELHLFTSLHGDAPWINMDALTGMKLLKSLKLTSPPFCAEWEQQEFVSAVSKSCPLLKEFKYWGRDTFGFQFPSDRLEIAGLERLTWNEGRCYEEEDRNFDEEGTWLSPKAAMSLINKSRLTLSHISLPADIDIPEVVTLLPLLNSYFPSLTSFHLGVWVEDPDPAINKVMSLFLISHPLIRHISLGFEEGAIMLSESDITGEMLPHLKSFHGHVNNIRMMARHGVRSLKTVTALSVGHVFSRNAVSDITAMFLELESFGGLPELEEFRFEPDESLELFSYPVASWIVKLATICPALERLSGDLGGWGPGETVSLLSSFPCLVQIDLGFHRLPGWDGMDVDYIRTVASQCHALKRVITFYRIFHIARDKQRPSISITVVEIKATGMPGFEYFGGTDLEGV